MQLHRPCTFHVNFMKNSDICRAPATIEIPLPAHELVAALQSRHPQVLTDTKVLSMPISTPAPLGSPRVRKRKSVASLSAATTSSTGIPSPPTTPSRRRKSVIIPAAQVAQITGTVVKSVLNLTWNTEQQMQAFADLAESCVDRFEESGGCDPQQLSHLRTCVHSLSEVSRLQTLDEQLLKRIILMFGKQASEADGVRLLDMENPAEGASLLNDALDAAHAALLILTSKDLPKTVMIEEVCEPL